MELLDSSDASLRKAGRALAAGKLVAIPTETVYGLGADAFDSRAVTRIFEAKARPSFDPLIVHIARLEDVERVASRFPPVAWKLAERLWPGPLTLVLPKRDEVPDIVTSGLQTVGVRFPSHPVARKIIEYSGTAIAAPSANPFGYISPTTAGHVVRMLGDKVDFVVDGGPCLVGVESTVLDVSGDVPRVLRPGGLPIERIEEVVGEVLPAAGEAPAAGATASPGMLDSHYAPRTRLSLYEHGGLSSAASGQGSGDRAAIVFDGRRAAELERGGRFARVFALSDSGDMREAAARLFALLHELDGSGLAEILAEKVPQEGLGRAINDRLFRASRK